MTATEVPEEDDLITTPQELVTPPTSSAHSPASSLTSSPWRDPYPSSAAYKEPSTMPTPPPLRRSTRDRKPIPKYAANVFTSGSFALYVTEPTCFEEVAEVTEWHDAIIEEIRAIEYNQTWELVDYQKIKLPLVSSGYSN